MSTMFEGVVNDVVSRFNECSEDKTKSTLSKCTRMILVQDYAVLTVIAAQGDIDNILYSSMREYAFELLYRYIYNNDLVELTDD